MSIPRQPELHELDEQREVVHAGMPLREKLALDPLQPPDRLVEQAPDLGDVPRDGEHLGGSPSRTASPT